MNPSVTSGSFPLGVHPQSGLWLRFRRGLWRWLLAVGAHRARHHLEQVARQHEASNPELAKQLREAARHSLES